MKRTALCLLSAGLAWPAYAEAPAISATQPAGQSQAQFAGPSYAQFLVDREVAKHPELAVLAMHVTPPKGADNIIIASNVPTMIGKKADADDLKVIETEKPLLAVNNRGDRYEVQLVLQDANKRKLGSLGVVFPYKEGDDKAAFEKKAEIIRDELARRISHASNLMEPASFDPSIPANSYGQKLVDDALAKNPDVVILALHATTKDHPGYPIVASNIGRLGKKADDDDMHVITSGETKLELNETGDRFEVEQTLLDVSGDTIGAVGVVFAYKEGVDKAPLQKQAEKIRAELQRRISNPENLLQPYPFDPATPTDTYAQKLVDDSIEKHPDLLILAFHVTPPGKSDNIIIASNIGRIGKKADEDDMRVVNTGAPNLEVNEKGNRFETELVFNDASGNKLGAISIVFAYKNGDDKEKLHQRAEAIAAEIAKKVPSLSKLFETA